MSDGDTAVGQVLAFLVAGVVFVAAMSAVLWQTAVSEPPMQDADQSRRSAEAAALAGLLVDSAGSGWSSDPDDLRALGLAGPDGGLDLVHLQYLNRADLSAQANDLVDYDEAALLLGLDPEDGTQFHLRIQPVALKDSVAAIDLSTLRVAYLADWQKPPSATVDLNVDAEVMANEAQAKLDAGMAAWIRTERDLLSALGVDFTDRVHIDVGAPDVYVNVLGVPTPITKLVPRHLLSGDVYPDHKEYLDPVLVDRLGRYDVLVIGTGVDQSQMTTSAIKYGIRDWVLAGGTLMVMGSDDQDVQWLQPIFQVGVATASGGVYAPATDHAMLAEPNDLDWPHYNNYNLAWTFKNGDEDKFQTVVVEGDDATLAVSRDGSYGDGRIILSTFRPHKIAGALGSNEAADFIHNLLVYAERDHLYVDFGPDIPDDTPVSAATRTSYVNDPAFGQVAMQVQVYVWTW